jgi:hypothetical protein
MARIKIERLALQVAGLTESESQSLAMQLADRLAQSPVPGSSRRIETMQVAMTLLDTAPNGQLASRIADELLRRVQREVS